MAPQPLPGDIAASPAGEPGPPPVVRVLLGLLLGAAAGVLAALLIPHPERARRTAELSQPQRSV